jgi:phosphoserine phosphatase
MAEPKGRIALFDVCGTLFTANTTLGFLDFLHACGGNSAYRKRRWAVASRRSPLFYVLAAVQRAGGRDVPRQVLISSLAGVSGQHVRAMARQYAGMLMATRAVAPIHARLREHQAAGDRVVLISSSIEPVVAAIAERLDVEFRASVLEEIDGVFSGRLSRDLTGSKHIVLEELRPGPGSHVVAYTDNLSDRPLIEACDRATVVLSSPDKRRRWRGTDAQFLEL